MATPNTTEKHTIELTHEELKLLVVDLELTPNRNATSSFFVSGRDKVIRYQLLKKVYEALGMN